MIPGELWQEFRKHRAKLRAPMTEYAEKLILAKLEKWQKEGANPVDILNESIERGWAGVFLNGHAAKSTTPGISIASKICKKCGTAQWVRLDMHSLCERCQDSSVAER